MIYQSHDLDTWSLIWSGHMIPIRLQTSFWHWSITNFNIRVTILMLWLRPSLPHHQSTRFHPIVDFEQVLRVFTSRSQWCWRERGFSSTAINESHWRSYFQVNAYPGSGGGSVRGGFPRSLLIKATGGSHGEWWAVWLAGRSLSPTLKDVNVSFNHPPYYLMSRGEGRVITNKRWVW